MDQDHVIVVRHCGGDGASNKVLNEFAKRQSTADDFAGCGKRRIAGIKISKMDLAFVPTASTSNGRSRFVDQRDAGAISGQVQGKRTAHDTCAEHSNRWASMMMLERHAMPDV